MALVFAALAVTTVWLKHAEWIIPSKLPPTPNLLERIASVSHAVLDPRNLQAYGVALGLLSLVWVVVRIIDLHRGVAVKMAGSLLQSRFSVDWFIRMAWFLCNGW